ncbi:hypothetical protein CXP39_03495 [Mesoplasma syrphidae]|uniref:Uncharacterized protein n=1 Tax=Mesoplasma syrphidae TaxID=225999 RepID=A0A2K9C2Y0_9MOLU|nr:hypothetical protein [Mesoplasma syrphidae]AUF83829.1 hypothetical protein CXP39_03495 [Mesoplasma syrphidae]
MILATNNTTAMPWWFWVIITILAIIGIVLGIWSFLSGFKSSNKINTNNAIEVILATKKYSWKQTDELPETSGLYIMFIGKRYDDKEFFIPIFIDKAQSIKAEVLKIKEQIYSNNKNSIGAEVTTYLLQKGLTATDINFYIVNVSENEIDKTLNEYLDLTKANKRGFKSK